MANPNSVPVFQQQDFDRRIKSQARPFNQSTGSDPGGSYGWYLQRGYLAMEQTTYKTLGYGAQPIVHFLYNPSTLAVSYQVQEGDAANSIIFPNPGDTANLPIPLDQSLEFTLFYDRSFELWGQWHWDGNGNPVGPPTPDQATQQSPTVIGAMHDVLAVQQMVGMNAQYQEGGNSGISSQWSSIAMLVPQYLIFSKQFAFYGYISEFDVQYTHFTEFFVPMRCVIDIQFTLLPPMQGSKGTQAGSGSVIPANAFPGLSGVQALNYQGLGAGNTGAPPGTFVGNPSGGQGH